jgi:hypothetical protein
LFFGLLATPNGAIDAGAILIIPVRPVKNIFAILL